jgi:hypothetical protein
MKILIIVVFLFTPFINAFEKNNHLQKNDKIIDELNQFPQYRNWIDFWKNKIPGIEGFILEKTDTVKYKHSTKIDVAKWLKEREFRKFTLDFSPKGSFVIDVYSHVGFEYKNDSIYVMGGDMDPSFEIINIKDSILTHISFGPYAFFDESLWASDSICYVLGFAVDDIRQDVPNVDGLILILKWDLSKNILTVIKSNRIQFVNKFMSFETYMGYLYPKFK